MATKTATFWRCLPVLSLLAAAGDNSGPHGPVTTSLPPPRCSLYLLDSEHRQSVVVMIVVSGKSELSAWLTTHCRVYEP